VFHPDRNVTGTLSPLFRWKMAVIEIGLFFATGCPCFQDQKNKLLRNKDAYGGYHRRFRLPVGIRQSFSIIGRRQASIIPFFDAEHIYVFRSVLLNHQSTVV